MFKPGKRFQEMLEQTRRNDESRRRKTMKAVQLALDFDTCSKVDQEAKSMIWPEYDKEECQDRLNAGLNPYGDDPEEAAFGREDDPNYDSRSGW